MGYERTLGKSLDGLGIIVNNSSTEKNSSSLLKWFLSSCDPYSSLMLEFSSKEDAMIYCERMG